MSLHRLSLLAICCVTALGLGACRKAPDAAAPASSAHDARRRKATVVRSAFGRLPEGAQVDLYTLTNAAGMEVRVINYGGIITAIKVPDRNGTLADVVLGFDSLEGYVKNPPYFGAVVGRYANRIAKAQFALDGKTYKLAATNGPNTLHGGVEGIRQSRVAGRAVRSRRPGRRGAHAHEPGRRGRFPGTLSLRVTFTLSDDERALTRLHRDHGQADCTESDPPRLLQPRGRRLGRRARRTSCCINADRFTPVDATLIPTGKLADVAGTPLDFRMLTPIGARIGSDDPQIKLGSGYDHNFVINHQGNDLALAARVEEPRSGRVLEVRTTEPGVQFYSANFLDGNTGKSGHEYHNRGAFCLETQHYPDSPNHPEFPTTTLRPGEQFHSRTVYAFSVK